MSMNTSICRHNFHAMLTSIPSHGLTTYRAVATRAACFEQSSNLRNGLCLSGGSISNDELLRSKARKTLDSRLLSRLTRRAKHYCFTADVQCKSAVVCCGRFLAAGAKHIFACSLFSAGTGALVVAAEAVHSCLSRGAGTLCFGCSAPS